MKTIAIPLFGSRVSPRFDCAQNFMLVTIKNGEMEKGDTVVLVQTNPLEKINTLIRLGVDVIICGGVSKFYEQLLEGEGVQLISGVRGEVNDILAQFMSGKSIGKDTNLTQVDNRKRMDLNGA